MYITSNLVFNNLIKFYFKLRKYNKQKVTIQIFMDFHLNTKYYVY